MSKPSIPRLPTTHELTDLIRFQFSGHSNDNEIYLGGSIDQTILNVDKALIAVFDTDIPDAPDKYMVVLWDNMMDSYEVYRWEKEVLCLVATLNPPGQE